MYFEKKIYKILNEEDSDKYSHIGYGKYKEKGKEDDPDAQTFQKTDAGKFEPVGDDTSAAADDKPKDGPKIDVNPFDKADDQADDIKSADAQAQKDKEDVKDALDGALEGMYDALNRGMDYGDNRDVDRMIDDDIQSALDSGATDDDLRDFAEKLEPDAKQMFQDSLDNLAYDLDVTDGGSKANLSPSDPNYKSPGEMDKLGSDNPYDKGDEYDAPDPMAQYDPEANPTLGDMAGDDMDQGIDDAIDGIRDDKREDAFDMIIQSFDDDEELDRIYQNLEAGKLPKPDQDPFGAIKHRIIMQGIEDGTLNFGSKGMELANYIETREEDLYQQMTEGKHFTKPIIAERISIKKTLRKRAGLL